MTGVPSPQVAYAVRVTTSEGDQGEGAGAQRTPADGGATRPEERLEQAVRAAEKALIEFEIAVETFRVEVENFSRLHEQKLGPMYARLEELDARILEIKAARSDDPEDRRKADEARARLMPIPGVEELMNGWMDGGGLFPEATAMLTDQPVRPPQRVRPGEEARKLYRELVRKAHPDLAQEDKERARREEFITRVNAAYARGSADELRELAEEWAAGPELKHTPAPRRSSTPASNGSPSARNCSPWSPGTWRRAPSAPCCGWPPTTPTGSWRTSPRSCGPRWPSVRRSWRRCRAERHGNRRACPVR